ncbi:histidine phosphatase family protein [Salisaeta longa]|uniref:histidine phosphatase family protein n=1 Tax=Salisaeta longa TaxID=503170 RepID=UPI0003B6969E|nr:histidine phosphatase family protein [Salisaeta longa]
MPVSSPVDVATTTLYLVRHGETEYNRQGIVQGRGIDADLNATGRAQAKALGERFATVDFDVAYVSPLRRTRQTARLVTARHRPLPTIYLKDLEEMAWGVYEGEPPAPDRDAAMNAIKEQWRAGTVDLPIEGGESPRDVEARAQRAVHHMLEASAGRTILVVTHGRYLRVLLASVLERGLHNMHEMGHANTCVNHLEYRDGRFQAKLLNCTAHLNAA